MDYKSILQIALRLISSPARAWEEIRLQTDPRRVFTAFVYPMIGLCGLSVFIGTLVDYGWGGPQSFQLAMTRCCAVAVALFGGYFLAAWLINAFCTRFLHRPSDLPGIWQFSGYALVVLFLLRIILGILPDFQILFYPVITMMPDITHKGSHDNFLGVKARKRAEQDYSSDLQVTRVTPRAFIALSDDDHTVLPANGVNYYVQLYRHDVPATLHVYPSGGHGWGNRDSFKYHNEMQLDLKAWLRSF